MLNTYYLISGFKEHSFARGFASSEDLNWHSVRRVSGLIREASTRQDLTNQWAANGLSVRKQGLGQVRVAWGVPSFLRRMGQNRSDRSPSNRGNYRKWWGPGCRTGCKMVVGGDLRRASKSFKLSHGRVSSCLQLFGFLLSSYFLLVFH